jgi:hypothetical protein
LRGFATLSIDGDCMRPFHASNSTLRILLVGEVPYWWLSDWNTLTGAQLEAQVGFGCAACGFD